MPRFIAFLRAINVGGHVVKMDELRAMFESLGLAQVETFIASGNVIFTSRSTDVAALEKKIEARLHKALGYEVATFLRTCEEVAAVAGYRPFPGARIDDDATVYVGFVERPLNAVDTRALMTFSSKVTASPGLGRTSANLPAGATCLFTGPMFQTSVITFCQGGLIT